jgi:hypothetical protein
VVQLVKKLPAFYGTIRSCSQQNQRIPSTSSDSMLSRSLLKTNSTVQDVLCTAVHGRRSLLPRSHTVLRYTKRRHFIQTRKKSTAFPARQHYVQICCAEFRYDRTANVQTADTTPLTSAKYGFHCTMQLAAVGRNFLYEVSTKSGQHTTTGRV